MNLKNEQFMALLKLPYKVSLSSYTPMLTDVVASSAGRLQVGIATTVGFGIGAIPAVFHRDFAIWFCSRVPPPAPSAYSLGAHSAALSWQQLPELAWLLSRWGAHLSS